MFASQHFISLAVLIISGDALTPESSPSCANGPTEFCRHVLFTHEANRAALKHLNEIDGRNGIKRLTQADTLVLALLNETDSTRFRVLLKQTLEAQLGALVMAKVDCFSRKESIDPDEEATCSLIYIDIGLGIVDLMEAIIAVETDKSDKATFQRLYDKIFEEHFVGRVQFPARIHVTGTEILTLMRP
ncbi:unnamed protein product [Nippostrongylus brasiliensis]|uniref:Secreted protein n=1 Tax=Nippostrongylus brasiliensis TaxID=27835 RepID=A0A0N4XWM5_NIPBR|nr:unnamed protein product [Nippostrongylus brasiliensis]